MRIFACFLACALTASAFAQTVIVGAPRPGGVTTLMLGADVANGTIAAAPGSRVRVPPLEKVVLLAPDGWPFPIQWMKDNKIIAGATNRNYTIPFATSADSGFYNLFGTPFPQVTTGIALEVVPDGHLGNFSARVELAAGPSVQIVGFSVGGTATKNLLVRAVGPTLKDFGLPKPVTQPRMRIFDSKGREFGFAHPAVVVDMDAFFRSTGAFPLTGGEFALEYGAFPPGTYTVQISDQSGLGGTALLEAYEFTTGPAPAGAVVVVPPAPIDPIVVRPPGG